TPRAARVPRPPPGPSPAAARCPPRRRAPRRGTAPGPRSGGGRPCTGTAGHRPAGPARRQLSRSLTSRDIGSGLSENIPTTGAYGLRGRPGPRLRPSYLIRVMPAKGVLVAAGADVVIAGGGVIGTAIAWRAAAAGLDVVLVDPGRGDAASLVAAGMLAPVSEALFGEGALLRLNLLAVARFGSFAAELEQVTGHRVGLRREGTLAVAFDAGDYAALTRLTAFRRSAGLEAEELDSRACRKLESFL